MLQQTRNQQGGGVCAERPRGVGVANDKRRVGQILQHGALPHELVAGLDGLAVDAQPRPARKLHLQPRRRDDDVGLDLLPGLQRDAVRGDGLDVARGDVRLALVQAAEEVAVGAHAHALLPRVVGGLEVRVVRDVLGQLLGCAGAHEAARGFGEHAAEGEEEEGQDEEL